MNLKTNYLGMELKNPLVVAAGPISQRIDTIKQLEDAGASAVVLYSLFEEQLSLEARSLHHYTTHGAESYAEAVSYFPEPEDYRMGPEEYLEHIAKAKEAVDIPVIASINGISRGGWTSYAAKMKQAGADALELNIYHLPTNPDVTGAEIEGVYLDILASVKERVSIPVAMKLSPFFSSLPNMARKLEKMGLEGMVLFNRFYQPDINLEELEVEPRVTLSNPGSMLLPLRWIAILRDQVKASLAASTGIHSAEDVIKTMMAGADVTQLCAALLVNGPKHLTSLLAEIEAWMTEKEYESIEQMKGSMSHRSVNEPSAFERANYMKALNSYQYE